MNNTLHLVSENTSSVAPLLTIVIPAYNHEMYVSECLQSIVSSKSINQIELIVIDDGSTDQTLAVIVKFLNGKAVNYRIFTKPNEGLTRSLDLGLNLARAEFIAIIASDDAYIPTGLDSVMSLLATVIDRETAILFQAENFGDLTGPVYGKVTRDLFELAPPEMEVALSIRFPRPMLLQSSVFGTRFLKSVSPWSDRLGLDDWPTFLKISQSVAKGNGSFSYNNLIVLCRYRIHSFGIHTNTDRQLRVCLEVADKVVDPSLRSQARANVMFDIAMIHLYEKRPFEFTKLFAAGIVEKPSLSPVFQLLKRVFSAVWKRVAAASQSAR